MLNYTHIYKEKGYRMRKILLSTAVMIALSTTAVQADGDMEISTSANMSLTSNYIWRGMTQSDDSPAIQGGIDLGLGGFYLGTWGSNISWTNEDDSSLELDVYAGYAGEVEGFGYDLGIIRYAYPQADSSNEFDEVYLGLSYDFGVAALSATYSMGLDNAPDDIEVGASVPLPYDIGFDVAYGDYDTVGSRIMAGVSKSFGKFDFSLAYIDFSADTDGADEDNVVFTVGTGF